MNDNIHKWCRNNDTIGKTKTRVGYSIVTNEDKKKMTVSLPNGCKKIQWLAHFYISGSKTNSFTLYPNTFIILYVLISKILLFFPSIFNLLITLEKSIK